MILAALMWVGCAPDQGTSEAVVPLRIAAAADLKFALDTLIAETQLPFPVEVVYGSSGNLRTQIEHGAPFDLFLSADMRFPKILVEKGLAEEATLFRYAVGRLVIWVPNESLLDVERLREQVLLEPEVRKIAVANPQHAPYGQAAVAALQTFGLLDVVQAKFVLGENIAQTAQFVESGAADVGILALALAVAPAMRDQGRFWEIPLETFPRLEQGGVITNHATRSGQREAAVTLRQVMLAPEGRAVLRRYGFIMPDETSPPNAAN